jgi:transposase-like protein
LLAGVTKAVLETALQTELSEHLGYEWRIVPLDLGV